MSGFFGGGDVLAGGRVVVGAGGVDGDTLLLSGLAGSATATYGGAADQYPATTREGSTPSRTIETQSAIRGR